MTTQEIDERINQLKKDMMDIDEKLDNIGDEIAALSDKVHARRWTNENIRDAKRIRLLFPHDATYIRCDGKDNYSILAWDGQIVSRIFSTMFGRMKVGETVRLDEIIGGVIYDKG